jgi:DNA adenine methylase
MAKPFVKWAGGKRQLLGKLTDTLPQNIDTTIPGNYAEPFVGGGAMMFKLFEMKLIEKAVICDFNEELILVYKTIKEDVVGLIQELSTLKKEYDSLELDARRELYFQLRDEFNNSKKTTDFSNFNSKWLKRASLFIFLNKTGFNGLYRVNKSGYFNVPPSNMADKDFVQKENLLQVSAVLANVTILHGDYQKCGEYLEKDWFVYFDPPYRPISATSFTTYSSHKWGGDKEQIRLADFCKELNEISVNILVSNSDPKQVNADDDFFETNYPASNGFKIQSVDAIRSINSKGDGRGKVKELLISNF